MLHLWTGYDFLSVNKYSQKVDRPKYISSEKALFRGLPKSAQGGWRPFQCFLTSLCRPVISMLRPDGAGDHQGQPGSAGGSRGAKNHIFHAPQPSELSPESDHRKP